MKKILALVLTSFMLTGMVGCGQTTPSPETTLPQEDVSTQEPTTPSAGTENQTNPSTDKTSEQDQSLSTDETPSSDSSPSQTNPPKTNTPSKGSAAGAPSKDTSVSQDTSKPQDTVKPPSEPNKIPPVGDASKAGSLEEVMTNLLKGVDTQIMTMNTEVTPDRFSWYFGIDPIEGAQGLASEAMIGSIAHSVGLLRVPEGVDVAKTAAAIEQKIDPRKWICVEAEKTQVKHKGNLILVVMSFEDVANIVSANFDNLKP